MKRVRCQRCSKWQKHGELTTLPEELYHLLKSDNEFGICDACYDTYTITEWEEWIVTARKKGKSFKSS